MATTERPRPDANLDIDLNAERTPQEWHELYETVRSLPPAASSSSVREFRREYMKKILRKAPCFCGYPSRKTSVRKRDSPLKGETIFICSRGACRYFRYAHKRAQEKSFLYARIRRAKLSRYEMRMGYRLGLFGNKNGEGHIPGIRTRAKGDAAAWRAIQTVQRKLKASRISDADFLKAKEYGLY